jgi:hypothetical protein
MIETLQRRLRQEEDGVAMVTVLLVTFVLLLLISSTFTHAIGSQNLSRREQDWNAALAAAETGVDDYLFRMNQDNGYWLYSATNPPPDGNLAFSTWVPVPGPNSKGSFRYTADTSLLNTEGSITLTSTGRVGKATRTVTATVRRRNFLDFLYFTDYETKDPAAYNSSDDFTPIDAQTYCAKHYYAGRDISGRVDYSGDTDGNTCTEITFISADQLNGPMHSNDAIRISGTPQFNDDMTTSWNDPSGQRWWGPGPGPTVVNPGDPSYAVPLTMPPTNVAIRSEADAALGGTGCLFTGPTSITLLSTGKMNVTSPFTKSSNCATGSNRNLPTNGVIYVQSVPTSSSDPNYTNGCPYNVAAIGSGGSPTRAHPLGYPQANDVTTYGCRDGDVFISGVLSGRLTIAADNNIVVVEDTTYSTGVGGTDLLGLVANNYVQIYHPVNVTDTTNCDGAVTSGGCNLRLPGQTTAFHDARLQAAILSVAHSFIVQNYSDGAPLGDLIITGAIAQRYRGPVGTFGGSGINTGYAKDYVYDQRLSYQSPPHFLDPVAAAWQVVTWAERPPALAWNAP